MSIDIEEFVLDATRFVFTDERLARCIENWIRTYGFLISPSNAVLGVFLSLIGRAREKQLNLNSISKRIHSYYSNLHKIYTRFEKFGLHEKLEKSD